MAYIPAGVAHLPINASELEAGTFIVARTDLYEEESVVLLPELEVSRNPPARRCRHRAAKRARLKTPNGRPNVACGLNRRNVTGLGLA